MSGSPPEGMDRRPNNPFPGLRPYRATERRLFFGRDEPTGELIGRLGRSRFLAVVGVSGSGKSSLVRCGVLPALHGGFLADTGSRWRIAMFRPGNDPIGELARALVDADLVGDRVSTDDALPPDRLIETVLRRGALGAVDAVRQARLDAGEHVLIIADQFEELFRYEHSFQGDRAAEDRTTFVKLLLEAARSELPLYVLLTMRSDFLGECAQFRDLPETINDGLYLIPRLTRDQLHETIVGPVAVAGSTIAPGLVNHLLNAVGDDPAQLPILQHALMRTWDAWDASGDGGSIDMPHHRTAGGLEGALDQHLGSILGELTAEQRDVAKRLFRHLVEVTPEGKKVRREATVEQLCAVAGAGISEVRSVIEAFRREGRTFLMPPVGRALDERTPVDLSHESLIERWKDLRDWIEDDVDSVRIYRLLSDAAGVWKSEGRSPYQDPELQRALDWWNAWGDEEATKAWARPLDQRSGRPDGFRHAREFLLWSERERARRVRRKVTRIAGGVAVLLAAVLCWALVSMATTRFEARAQQIEFAASRPDPLEGALILTELQREPAWIWRLVSRIWPPLGRVRVREGGRGAEVAMDLAKRGIPAAVPPPYPSPVREVAFDARGERLLTLFDDDTVELVNDTTGEVLALPPPIASAQGRIKNVFFADDSTFAFFDEDNTLRTAGGASVAIPPGRDYSAFSPDGTRFLALYTQPGVVCVWRLDPSSAPPADPPSDSDGTPDVGRAGSACQETLAGASAAIDQPPPSADAPPGDLVLAHARVAIAHFSPDGVLLASRSYAQDSVLGWDLETGRRIGQVPDNDNDVLAAAISDDAGRRLLATAHRGRVARVWELRSDAPVLRCELTHEGAVASVSFARTGSRVVTASVDGTARLWDVGAGACAPNTDRTLRPRSLSMLAGHDGALAGAAFTRDSSRLVTMSSADSTVRLWSLGDLEGGDPPRAELVLRGSLPTAVALSPNGALIATGGARGDVRIYRTTGTRWFMTLAEGDSVRCSVGCVAVRPDGSGFATIHPDSTVRFWDRDGDSVGTSPTLDQRPSRLAFGTDGRLYAAFGSATVVWTAGNATPERTVASPAAVRAFGFGGPTHSVLIGLDNGWVYERDTLGAVLDSINVGEGRGITTVARNRAGVTAAGDRSGKLRVWTQGVSPVELGSFQTVRAVGFSPDGGRLAAITGDTVRVMSVTNAARARRADAGEDWLAWRLRGAVNLNFTSDSTLLTVTREGAIQSWHASRGDLLSAFDAGTSPVVGSAVPLSGSIVATHHDDRTVRIWPLDWGGLLHNLRERATHACLEAGQRRRGLGEKATTAEEREATCRARYQTDPREER